MEYNHDRQGLHKDTTSGSPSKGIGQTHHIRQRDRGVKPQRFYVKLTVTVYDVELNTLSAKDEQFIVERGKLQIAKGFREVINSLYKFTVATFKGYYAYQKEKGKGER